MDDLVRWLTEQLDEDERIAREATLGPWVQSGVGDYGWTVGFGLPGAGVETADTEQGLADAAFIAAHDPARVLREVEAKRAIVDDLADFIRWGARKGLDYQDGVDACERTLKRLALPYADRPGYREEWRP